MFQLSIQRLISPRMGIIVLNIIATLIILGSVVGLWHTLKHRPTIQQYTAVEPVIVSREADHIFGAYQAPLTVAVAEKLVLKGIFAADDPATGAAIIMKKGQSAKLYIVGDVLPGGARLLAVRETEVELDVRGQRSVLKLPEKYLPGLPPRVRPGAGLPVGSSQ